MNPLILIKDRETTPSLSDSKILETVFIFLITFIACYFNSLIQAYFYIPQFAEKILKSTNSSEVASSSIEREKACKVLVNNLSGLFSKMILTNKKYTEPSLVLRALVDDFGHPMLFGE